MTSNRYKPPKNHPWRRIILHEVMDRQEAKNVPEEERITPRDPVSAIAVTVREPDVPPRLALRIEREAVVETTRQLIRMRSGRTPVAIDGVIPFGNED